MLTYEEHFYAALKFMKTYENLINCHLVDFLIENLWEKCVPLDLKLYLEKEGSIIVSQIAQFDEKKEYEDVQLYTFLKNAKNLKLEYCYKATTHCDFLKIINYKNTSISKSTQSELMKSKKWHEVDIFTKTVVWLDENESSIIIDAGAGKGYSSLHLSNYYNFPVLAIECSLIKHRSAILYQNLINKKYKQSTPLIHYIVEQINETTDFIKMVKNYFPNLYTQKKLIITALHACGSLTDSLIKSFLNNKDIKSICIVPCCYHLSIKSLLNVYEFSKNSRMLAQQSVERIEQKNISLSPSLFYRAILQVIFQAQGIKDIKVGRGAPLDNFVVYAKWAFKKAAINEVPSDEVLNKTYETFKGLEWKFHIFQLLRIHLAPVIEAAIILDKVLFLHNSELCGNVKIVQLFDPLLSPRNWAILATK